MQSDRYYTDGGKTLRVFDVGGNVKYALSDEDAARVFALAEGERRDAVLEIVGAHLEQASQADVERENTPEPSEQASEAAGKDHPDG